jgi:hypothetical protein
VLELDNPASRFLALLTAGGSIQQADKTQIREAWRRILEVEEGDQVTLLRRIGLVYTLPGEIQAGVLALDNVNHDLLLEPLAEVNAALALPINKYWNAFTASISDKSRYGLKVIEDNLQRSSLYVSLDEDGLARIQGEIQGLLEQVLGSEVEPDLRQLLVRHLQQMQSAIVEIRLRGADALRDASEAAIGGAILYDQLHPVDETAGTATSKPERRRFLKGMVACAAGLLVVVNTANAALELEAKVNERFFDDEQKALEPGANDEPADPTDGP